MRRPSNYAIYNKLRPSEVGLEADKPETLKDGESYFATDTYRLYYGGKKGSDPFSVKGFPYNLTLKDPSGADCFRFFLDPVNGDDNNNGLLWSTAKKTLSAIYEVLPQDLQDHIVFIYMQSGTVNDSWDKRFYNGQLYHHWCGTHINALTDDWSIFRKGGEENPIRDDGQIIFKGTDDSISPFVYNGSNLTIDFAAFNHTVAHYQNGFCFFDRIVFEDPDTVTPNQHEYLMLVNTGDTRMTIVGVTFKLIGAKYAGFYGYVLGNGMSGVKFDLSEAIGEAVTSTSIWRSVVMARGNDPVTKFAFGKIADTSGAYVRYDDVYKPAEWLGGSDAQIVVDGNCKNLYSNGASICKANYYDLDENDLILRNATDVPNIMLSSEFEGTIKYTSAQTNLVDASTHPRIIKDYTTNVETVYLTNRIKQAGDNVVFDLPTSDPAVAGALWNDTGTVKVSTGP